MNQKDLNYFTRMSNYAPRGVKKVYSEFKYELDYLVNQIHSTARDALNSEISSTNAKDTISELEEIIKKLKRVRN